MGHRQSDNVMDLDISTHLSNDVVARTAERRNHGFIKPEGALANCPQAAIKKLVFN